ncbi:E3 ubiquitin-protein ligase pellino homolog 2 [Hirundo rustica]|uniref:E3 ubiquitin-protein ligase pellino homolog 2 n=1 Tax=Hirundo rustica TaxID=43150 RepID=UPI001A93C75A|nr:E3 ubiquitin-protein ligase pellino homolog 2 [Hirundo rustica]
MEGVRVAVAGGRRRRAERSPLGTRPRGGGSDGGGRCYQSGGLMFSPSQEELCALNKEPVKYGELVVLGYNGSLPNGDRGRRKSRFALYKRSKASGVKPSTVHVISTPQASKAVFAPRSD